MNSKRVYNVFQINIIVSIIASIMAMPTVMVVIYIFNIQNMISMTNVWYIGFSILITVTLVSALFTFFTRDRYRRRLKPSYQREFTFCLTATAIGILGSGVLFMFLGGDEFYVPHVIIPIGILAYSILYVVGNRFFNVQLIKR